MTQTNGTSEYHKRKTDPAKRKMHKVNIRNAYVCSCGEEFRTFTDWQEHRTEESLITPTDGTIEG